MELEELIDLFESLYSVEQRKEILEYFWKADKNSYIPDSDFLFELIQKGYLKVTDKKYIGYRLEKYFAVNNIEKISARKAFIFEHLPNTKGLKRGKNTSYDDLIDFIKENYVDLFDEILSEFKTYDYGNLIGDKGHLLTLYLYRTVGKGSNYKFNYKTEEYELKNDEVTKIMQERGYKMETPTGDPREVTLEIDLTETMQKCQEDVAKMIVQEKIKTQSETYRKLVNKGGKFMLATIISVLLSIVCILFLLPAIVLLFISLIYFIRAALSQNK